MRSSKRFALRLGYLTVIDSKVIAGVSVVICAHNAAARLPKVLAHLLCQKAAPLSWEVLLVDNASTDDTGAVALRCWSAGASVPLRVVRENELGLAAARQRGVHEARYEFVSFVDDDNWVANDWVLRVAELMQAHPRVGALGGYTEFAGDIPAPPWFGKFQGAYAVGPQADVSGDVTHSRGYLWGAGFTLRRSAMLKLFQAGFNSQLSGRKGKILSAGDDSEICHALRLAGWSLWYDADLRLQHFMPAVRLRWPYHRDLWGGFGQSSPMLDAYTNAHWVPQDWRQRVQQSWYWQAAFAAYKISWRYGLKQWRPWPQRFTQAEVYRCFYRARLLRLLQLRGEYDRLLRAVRSAAWMPR